MGKGNTLAGSDETTRTSVRFDDDLLDALDETIEKSDRWKDRSKWVRDMARRTVDAGPQHEGLVPPVEDDLASAYETLLGIAGPDGWVPLDDATTILSNQDTPKKAVERRLLRPLQDRGYIRLSSDWFGEQQSIKVRGAD